MVKSSALLLIGAFTIAATVSADEPPPVPLSDQAIREALGGLGDFRGFCTITPFGGDLLDSLPAWFTTTVAAKARYVTVQFAMLAATPDETDRACISIGGSAPSGDCLVSDDWAQQLLPNQTFTVLLRPNSSTGELQPLYANLEGNNSFDGYICLGVSW